MKNTPIRHGELLLKPVSAKQVKGKKEAHKSFIAAHSETGHNHVIESDVDFNVSTEGLEVYVELFEPAKLVHKKTANKHQTLPIAPGFYQVIQKTEYNPFTGLSQKVWD